jgi:thiol-disulfide isomerase/thioredoxin
MIERSIVVVAVAVIVLAVTLIVRAVAARGTAQAAARPLPDLLRDLLPGAGIVYFFGPHCATCRQQREVLDKLSTDAGIPVVAIDAVDEPALAAALNVLTVPTTVVVDAGHAILAINPGFRPLAALQEQILPQAA